jgi:hypothetical protein
MAANQFINFNTQDVADMYRRQQLASMLQEKLNTPVERYSFQGFEAPISPLQGLAKGLDAYSVYKNQSNLDERYAGDKAAAEQKMAAEQERRKAEVADYQKGFEPTVGYGGPTAGGVGDIAPQGQMVATPRSRGEILAQALRGAGSDNPQIANIGRMQYEQQNAMAQDENRAAERELTRQDMLAGRAQTQQNYEGTQAQNQRNADKQYNLQLEKLRQGRLPTAAAQEKATEKQQGATNAATTINQLASDYESLNKIGGLRNLNQDVIGRSAASLGNALPYALQTKDAAMLRERIDANIQSLLGPLMKASGMTSQQINSNAEREAFMKSLGGPGTSYETNMSILQRVSDTLNPGSNKESQRNADMDKYAPKGK